MSVRVGRGRGVSNHHKIKSDQVCWGWPPCPFHIASISTTPTLIPISFPPDTAIYTLPFPSPYPRTPYHYTHQSLPYIISCSCFCSGKAQIEYDIGRRNNQSGFASPFATLFPFAEGEERAGEGNAGKHRWLIITIQNHYANSYREERREGVNHETRWRKDECCWVGTCVRWNF